MNIRRFFVTALLVVGLVGVHAQEDDELSAEGDQLAASWSTEYVTDEDAPLIDEMDKVRRFKRSDPKSSKGGMSKAEYEWHIKEGEAIMMRIMEETAAEKRALLKRKRNQVRAEQTAPKKILDAPVSNNGQKGSTKPNRVTGRLV